MSYHLLLDKLNLLCKINYKFYIYRFKAPPSYLLNETLTGFRDPHLEELVDAKTKHNLINLAIQEYELMNYLAK
jgi:hypothetical protein